MRKRNTKVDPNLLAEEAKRNRMLSEYSFYTGDDDANKAKGDTKDLLLGDIDEADEDPKDNDLDQVDTDVDKVGDDLGVDVDLNADDNGDNPEGEDINVDQTDDSNGGEDVDLDMNVGNEPPAEPASDEVEVDVTQLVQGTEEAKKAADISNKKMEQLFNKFTELETKLSNMDKITTKIDNLEHEIEKRVPTPQEKLEMRSLNSYPYSLKLTDYWSEKEGAYDVMNKNTQKPKEYILTKDDVDHDYNERQIKDSLNNYTEEDI